MRLKSTAKNTTFGLISHIIKIAFQIVTRTFFIHYLGIEYLGISGLFTNILLILSLSELGLGPAIVFSLYKPLANNNKKKIKALMNFYKLSYKIIGLIVLLIGLLLIPFLDHFIKDSPDIKNLTLIYLLFLLNSVISYFFGYQRSILSANQQEYINSLNNLIFMVIQNIIQIIILVTTQNFLLYLLVVVVCTLLSNLSILRITNKMYPYLKNNIEKLEKNERKTLFKYIYAQLSHKIGGVVVSGTDNLLISSFLGIIEVGLYSNYLLIIRVMQTFLNMVFVSATASVGNLIASVNMNHVKKIYNRMLYVNVWLFGISAISFINLINDFITLWIGKEYLFEISSVMLIAINFFINGMRQSTITFNTTLGLFWNDRYKPWFEAGVNLIFSIMLLKLIGLKGVFLGTIIGTITTSFWVEPFILYKHGFKQPLSNYFFIYVKYTIAIIIASLLTYLICSNLNELSWFLWICKAFISIIITSLTLILFFYRSDEHKYFSSLIKSIIKAKVRR